MAPRKKMVPAAFAVVATPKAQKLVAAEGKLDLMTRAREYTENGEKLLRFLVRVVDGDGSISQGLDATKILLAYGWGKPIETQVTADVSATPAPPVGVKALTTEQLEAVVNGSVVNRTGVTEGEDIGEDSEGSVE